MAEITREQLILALIQAGERPRLAGLDLSGLKLTALNLSKADLKGADLSGASLDSKLDLSGSHSGQIGLAEQPTRLRTLGGGSPPAVNCSITL